MLNNAFYGKTIENVRNRCKIKFPHKDNNNKIIKQPTKLTFNGTHKSYTNYVSYVLKQNEDSVDTPIYLKFAILKFSNLHMYQTYYDKLQPYLGQDI